MYSIPINILRSLGITLQAYILPCEYFCAFFSAITRGGLLFGMLTSEVAQDLVSFPRNRGYSQ